MLATIAGFIAPVMKPLGLGDWRVSTALISGFMAKESVVSTLQILYTDVTAALPNAAAMALLVFSSLYTPCVAAISAIKRELGGLWAVGVVIFQCAIAWLVGLATYLICGLFL